MTSKNGGSYPESLFQLLVLLGKGFVKNIPRMLVRSVVIGVLVWVIHTYLLVAVNNGFAKTSSESLAHVLASPFIFNGNVLRGTLFWAVAGWLVSYIIFVRVASGPAKFISDILKTPVYIIEEFKHIAGRGLYLLLIFTASALIISIIIKNYMITLLLAIVMFLFLSLQYDSLMYLAVKLAHSDWQRIFRAKKPSRAFAAGEVILCLTGIFLGFLIFTFLPNKPYSAYLGVAFTAGVGIFLMVKKRGAAANSLFFTYVCINILWYLSTDALAHDGGLIEAGNDWGNWWESSGRNEALNMGNAPALGAGAGAAAGGSGLNLAGIPQSGDVTGDTSDSVDTSRGTSDNEDSDNFDGIDSINDVQGGPGDNPYTEHHSPGGNNCTDTFGIPFYWVNTVNLSLVVQDTVFSHQGLGPKVMITQYNNSNPSHIGMFGNGWSMSYESLLEENGDMVALKRGSGQQRVYRLPQQVGGMPAGPMETIPPAGVFDRLICYGNYWLMYEKRTRLIYRYDKSPGTRYSMLTLISDHNGNSLTINYNPDGTIRSVIDAPGREISFVYNSLKFCTSFVLPDGRKAAYDYDSKGNMVRAVDLEGIVTEYEYDADNYITRMIIGRERRSNTFSYQQHKNSKQIAAITDSMGSVTHYEVMSANPTIIRITDPEGHVNFYQSSNGLTTRVTDPLENYTETVYENALPLSSRDKKGAVTRKEYDFRGNLTRLTDVLGSKQTFSYDNGNNLVGITDNNGCTETYSYDDRNNLIKVRSALGREIVMDYDAKGQMIAANYCGISRTTFDYDRFGNLSSLTDPLGNKVVSSFDRFGYARISGTDALGNTILLEYDKNNRITKINYPDGTFKTHGYSCCAGILTTDENGCHKAYERDGLLNITRYIDALLNTVTFQYNRNSSMTKIIDALGRATLFTCDAAKRVVGITYPSGNTIKMDYDQVGNLISLRDERDKLYKFEYAANNLPLTVTDPDGSTVRLAWDCLKRKAGIKNARGEEVSMVYNADCQVTAKLYNGVQVVTNEYDPTGKQAKVTDTAGTTIYNYNTGRQVTDITYPQGHTATFVYDRAGNISSVTYPGSLTVNYKYDSRNRIESVTWGRYSVTLTYDRAGNLTGEMRTNSTLSSYEYNANNQLKGIKHIKGNSAFIDLKYTIDAVGNYIQEEGFKPLAAEAKHSDRMDSPIYVTYNDCNQILTLNGDAYTYDKDGNLTTITGNRQFNAVYDPENRPVEITINGRSTRYTYNGIDQRCRAVTGEQVRNYHYNFAGQLMFETDASDCIIRYYIYAGNRLMASVVPDGTSSFYYYDKTGNTLALADDTGEITAAYAYSPFGAVVNKTGSVEDNPFTFVGAFGVMDDGGDLYFMKNRYYDSLTGRFIQKDPIGFNGGFNLYSYVSNNPVTLIDPEGTEPVALAVILTLIAFTASLIVAGRAAQRFGERNPITRVLTVAPQGDPVKNAQAIGPNPRNEYFNDPNHGMIQVIETTGDKMLGNNPISAPAWSAISVVKNATEDKPLDTVLDAASLIPGTPGAVAGIASEINDICTSPK
jgi:RHS repeat-associated protein